MEPSTSSDSVKVIKTEPSVPIQRLTSFRIPRDLTLGENIRIGKPKKVYAPNLNVQRNKQKVEPTPVKVDDEKPGKKSHQRTRGATRGRNKSNIVQSVGVWSEGGSTRSHKKYSRFAENATETKKSKPKLNIDKIIDNAKDEEKFQDFLNDDFIDDDVDVEPENAPMLLPMLENKKLYKSEEPKLKLETNTYEDEEIDKKPIILESGEAVIVKNENQTIKTKTSNTEKKEITVSEIIEDKTNSFILIRFPDNLPGLESKEEEIRPKLKSNDSSNQNDNDNKVKSNESIFDKLDEGFLGKLEILKSGKARLCLGESNLVVEIGSHSSFHQDLLAAKTDAMTLEGNLINLGAVNNTLLCSPDWENMLED